MGLARSAKAGMAGMKQPTQRRQKKRKFKGTRDLIRRALNDGYTPLELRRMLRVSEAEISQWSNGEGLAQYHVLRPLIDQYGVAASGRQRRHLYATLLKSEAPDGLPSGWPCFEWRAVVGDVIFRHVGKARIPYKSGRAGTRYRAVPVSKLVVHRNVHGQLLLVLQERLRFAGLLAKAWAQRLSTSDSYRDLEDYRPSQDLVMSDDPDAIWTSEIRGPLEPGEIIGTVEQLLLPGRRTVAKLRTGPDGKGLEDPETGAQIFDDEERWDFPRSRVVADAMVVPYRLRRALLDAGYDLDGVQTVEHFE